MGALGFNVVICQNCGVSGHVVDLRYHQVNDVYSVSLASINHSMLLRDNEVLELAVNHKLFISLIGSFNWPYSFRRAVIVHNARLVVLLSSGSGARSVNQYHR